MTDRIPGTRTKRGVLTKVQRAALTDTLAADILKVYRGLGGAKWLLEWAKANPSEFMKLGLARLLPPMPKDPAEEGPLVNIAFNGDPIQQARSIAFALARGAAAQDDAQEAVLAERVPYVHVMDDPIGPTLCAGPSADPLREEWARQAAMTPMERLDAETLDEHTNRAAFRETSAPAVTQRVRTPVRLHNPRNRDDLL